MTLFARRTVQSMIIVSLIFCGIASTPAQPRPPIDRTGKSRQEIMTLQHLRLLTGERLGSTNVDSAMGMLKETGPAAAPMVAKALADEKDPVARMRLEVVLKMLEPQPKPSGGLPPHLKHLIDSLAAPDPKVRMEAAAILGRTQDPAAVDPLIATLADADPAVRENAAAALRQISGEMFAVDPDRWKQWWEDVRHPKEKVEDLIARLSDPREEERTRAIWKLGFIHDPKAVEELVDRFANRRGGPRGAEIYDWKDYIRDHPHLRAAVINQGMSAVDRLIPVAVAGYGWDIHEKAADIIVRLGPAALPPLLKALMEGPTSEAKEGAAQVLAKLHPLEAVAPLAASVRQDSTGLTMRAFETLAGYDRDAAPAFKQVFADDKLPAMSRLAAAVMLAHFGDKSGWPMLEDLVANGKRFPMNQAVGFMGHVKDQVFLPLIEKALERTDAEQVVAYAAAYCGGKDATAMLTKALQHPNEGVRWGARMWLDKFAGKE